MRPTYPVTELLGDGIGAELSRAIHRLAGALPVQLDFVPVDFRLENRRARGQAVYDQAVEAITTTGVALKHPTTTAEESPNAILRRRLDLAVIHRPVYTIPGVPTNFRRELDLDIVRIGEETKGNELRTHRGRPVQVEPIPVRLVYNPARVAASFRPLAL